MGHEQASRSPSPLWGGNKGGGDRDWMVVAHPPPSLPRKGGGVSIRLLVNKAPHDHDRHLPPCGGGWEGGGHPHR